MLVLSPEVRIWVGLEIVGEVVICRLEGFFRLRPAGIQKLHVVGDDFGDVLGRTTRVIFTVLNPANNTRAAGLTVSLLT